MKQPTSKADGGVALTTWKVVVALVQPDNLGVYEC